MKVMRNKTGFTMVEVVLAIALGAVILTSLSMMFNVSIKGWRANEAQSELMQHARIALTNITRDLRHLLWFENVDADTCEFYAENFLGSSPEILLVRYHYDSANNILSRFYDKGTSSIDSVIAGDVLEDIRVDTVNFIPLKRNNSDELVEILGTDPLHCALAMRVNCTIRDNENNSIVVGTTVLLRNRYPKESWSG